jgi:hypothetical protein
MKALTSTETIAAPVQNTRTSKQTSINSARIPRIGKAVAAIKPWVRNSVNLDIGGGRYDSLTAYLKDEHGVLNLIYDPFNRSPGHNATVLRQTTACPPDTITLSNVLNVIDDEEIAIDLLKWAYNALAIGGSLYVTIYEGNRSKVPTFVGSDQYQANKPTNDYLSMIEAVFGNVAVKHKVIIANKITVY